MPLWSHIEHFQYTQIYLLGFFMIISGEKASSFVLIKLKYFDTYQDKSSLHLQITIRAKYRFPGWFVNSYNSFRNSWSIMFCL